MPALNKKLYRAAAEIHAALVARGSQSRGVVLPEGPWDDLFQSVQRVELAQERGWHSAARRERQELLSQLDQFQQSLTRLIDGLQDEFRERCVPSQGELYRDLVVLQEEYAQVEFNAEDQELCVTTEPVELEGIHLGRFKICLAGRHLSEVPAYRVVALDPNPAASNGDVTHPHVSDEQLCEGDGRRAIAGALTGARLLDFFSLVNQLLNTYGQGRAYVELESWYGIACHDCGNTVDEEDRCFCSHCDDTLCSHCTSYCGGCDESFCWNCRSSCPQCDQPFCANCLEHCPDCGNPLCPDCLSLNENLCRRCYDHEQETLQEEAEAREAEAAGAAVQSSGLGQAAVSA